MCTLEFHMLHCTQCEALLVVLGILFRQKIKGIKNIWGKKLMGYGIFRSHKMEYGVRKSLIFASEINKI